MNEHISADRLIGHHRAREDYLESPVNALQFGYGDKRYSKMTYELLNESDQLKEKTLRQAIEDFSLYLPLTQLRERQPRHPLLRPALCCPAAPEEQERLHPPPLGHPPRTHLPTQKKVCSVPMGRQTIIQRNCIEEFQKLIHDELSTVKSEVYEGLIDFSEYTEGIEFVLSKESILNELVDKLIEEKVSTILLKAIILLKVLMQGEAGTPKALKTEIILRLMALIGHDNEKVPLPHPDSVQCLHDPRQHFLQLGGQGSHHRQGLH